MNIKEILKTTEKFFKKHQIPSPRLDAEVLLADLLKMERIQLYVNYDYPLKEKELNNYRKRVMRRAKREPVAYITGHQEFMSLDLKVDQNVLIPRPETELLVEEIINYCEANFKEQVNIVDVCTGSGAIMVSLGYNLKQARILGTDISGQAISVARKNIDKFNLQKRLKVIKGDLLQPLINNQKKNVDIIVSNPPYIKKNVIKNLSPEVNREPAIALDGGESGLEYYKRLIPQVEKVLQKEGLLFLEIGANQADALKKLLKNWKKVRVKKDYAGHDRIVIARELKLNDN